MENIRLVACDHPRDHPWHFLSIVALSPQISRASMHAQGGKALQYSPLREQPQ